jgi:hypothetical protein
MPNLATYLNRTSIFEWCVVSYGSNHIPNNRIASNLTSIHALEIIHCTLNLIWRGSLHYEKSTSNHHSVKLRRPRINLIFNQPKHHSSRCVGANCSFTCLHKTMVLSALYLASTTSLITVSIWSLVDYKGNYKHKAELKYVSECRNLSREVTSGAKSRQFRSEWTPLGVHVCLDE